MSYRNPQQVVDTQSGQHFKDMQKSLSNTFDKYADSVKKEYERRAALNKEIVEKSQERVNKASNDINQVASQNSSINFDQMRDNLDKYGEYMQINPAERSKEMNSFISNMNNAGTNAANHISNTMAAGELYMEARNKGLGKMGGIYQGGGFQKDKLGDFKSQIEKFDVYYGYKGAVGTKKMQYDPITNQFRVNIFGKNNKPLGSSLNATMESIDLIQTIPDETEPMKAMATRVEEQMDLKSVNSEAYRGVSYDLAKPVNGVRTYTAKPSRDLYLKLALPLAKAELADMPAGDQIALYNDVLSAGGTNGDIIKWDKEWVKGNDSRKDIIVKAYADYVATKFSNEALSTSLNMGTSKPAGSGTGSDTGSDAKTRAAAAKRKLFKADLHAISKDNMTLFQDKVDAMTRMGIEVFVPENEENSKKIGVRKDKKAFMNTTGDSRNTMIAMAQAKGFGLAEAEEMVDEVIEEDRIEAEETMKTNFNSVYTVPNDLKNASIVDKLKHKAEAFGKYEKEENARRLKAKKAYEKENTEKYYRAWLERRAKENFEEEEEDE